MSKVIEFAVQQVTSSSAESLDIPHLTKGVLALVRLQMASEPHWYCPLMRYVIFPREIHISHSMKQLMRQNKHEVTINKDFEGVIRGCSTAQGRNEEGGAWLLP